jgi:hypothetical protein
MTTCPVLAEINQVAHNWHEAFVEMSRQDGRHSKWRRVVENTEERLELLWMQRRERLAWVDVGRFMDWRGPTGGESVFERVIATSSGHTSNFPTGS